MGKDIESVLKTVKDENVGLVRFWFTDMLGFVKSFEITPEELEDGFTEGMGFDASSIVGFAKIHQSDMIAMPDPKTFQVMPWATSGDTKIARVFCDILNPDGTPYPGDPRGCLKRIVKKAADKGYTSYFGPELEFFYFKDASPNRELLDEAGYFDIFPSDNGADIRVATAQALKASGIDVEYVHHEVAPSQHEIDLRYDDAIEMADKAATYRVIVKEIARQHGVYATFMPKPIYGKNGSGMHCHQSLFKGKENAFWDEKDKHHLSKTAKSYIAGLLKYVPEITIVLAQWVNSYKRLVPGYEAPCYVAWAQRNRSALVRVPYYKPEKAKATRAELRCPDPAANISLAFAVMLAAGLKGVEENLACADPVEADIFHMSESELADRKIKSLPATLGDAVKAAENSQLLRETLGDHIFNALIENKKQEWDAFRLNVTEWEINRYVSWL